MERPGGYRLAVQRGDYGYFAEVALTVEIEAGPPGLTVECAERVEAAWEAGARFGIAYALERARLPGGRDGAVRVVIRSVRGHVVDTTSVLVAYASARALWGALEIAPSRDMVFDDATATVLFPK